jgi:hypothetical protein
MGKKSRLLPPKEMVLEEPTRTKVIARDRLTQTKEFKTLAEKVAQSSVYHRNWYVPELREKYRFFDRIKRIDMVFPYARTRGMPEMLLVDLPQTDHEVEQCAMKSKILSGHGYLYCWIEKDSTLGEVLMQIGEL